MRRRPFRDAAIMAREAESLSRELEPADWLEAFAAHPRIGESGRSGGAGQADTSEWSRQEQAGASGASDALRERLTARHRDYEARFGYIFIVCASGKRAEEMLAILERRLAHSASDELRAAAQEQRKITHLRIAKLLT